MLPVEMSVREIASRYFHSEAKTPDTRFLSLLVSVGAVLSAAALAGIVFDVGRDRIWSTLIHADWTYVIFVPLAVVVSHLGYTLAYREVTHGEKDRSLSFAGALHVVTTGFGPLSPRGGYSIDIREMRRRGVAKETAEQRVRVLGLLEYAVLAPATLVAAAYMVARGIGSQDGLLPSWIIGVPLGAAVAVAVLGSYRRRGAPAGWWKPLRRNLDAMEELLDLLRSWPHSPVAVFGMVLYWAAEISALGLCIDIFGHRRGAIAVMIVGYATGYALTRRSLPLAGAGVVEALMPFALTWVGFHLAPAVLAVVAYRIFNFWLAMIPAVIGLRRLDREDDTEHEPAEAAA